MDALLRCLRHPGTQAYLFRRTYRELKDTVLGEAHRSVPAALGEYSASDYEYRLVNGSVMRFRHCQYDEDRTRYQGAEIQWLYIDELTHFSRQVYDFLKSRLRARRALNVKPLVRATANPGGIGHAWVRAHFVDRGAPEKEHAFSVYSGTLKKAQRRSVMYIPALCTDNPYLTPDYVFELEQKPRALRDALLFGRWDAFEGQVFSECSTCSARHEDCTGTHVIADFVPPPFLEIATALFDFGFSRPFAVIWTAVDPDARAYVYRELYGAAVSNEGACARRRSWCGSDRAAIVQTERTRGGRGGVGVAADFRSGTPKQGESIAARMAEKASIFRKGTTRLAGEDAAAQAAADETGRPGLYVMRARSAHDPLVMILALAHDPMCPRMPTRRGDHIYDALRYFPDELGPAAPSLPKARRTRPRFDPLSGGPKRRKGFWDG